MRLINPHTVLTNALLLNARMVTYPDSSIIPNSVNPPIAIMGTRVSVMQIMKAVLRGHL